MLRHSGLLFTTLSLAALGPAFAQSVRPGAGTDPLTKAWFDTVQSIDTLGGLAGQLEAGHPGAVENLRRNTEAALGDEAARQARLAELEAEIARLQSELELLRRQPAPLPALPTVDSESAAPEATLEVATVGLSDADRRAMILAARPSALRPPHEALPPAPEPSEWDRLLAELDLPPEGAAGGANDPAAGTPTTTLVLPPLQGAPADGAVSPAPAGPPASAAPVAAEPAVPVGAPNDAGTRSITDRLADAAQRARGTDGAQDPAGSAAASLATAYSADPLLQGRAAYFAGEYSKALALLTAQPEVPAAVYWSGRSLEKLDRAAEAITAYERVLADATATELHPRAQLDLDFLRWKWEHDETFRQLSAPLGEGRRP
jgi:hypothetical protein